MSKEVKDNFKSFCTRSGFSARLLFKKLLNSYIIQIQQQANHIDKTIPITEKKLYKIISVPSTIELGLINPEGWEGPLPVKNDITSDKNKMKMLEKSDFKFEEIKKTF